MLAYRAILQLYKSKIYLILYQDNYRYRDNFVVYYRDTDFTIITQP